MSENEIVLLMFCCMIWFVDGLLVGLLIWGRD